MKKNKIFQSEFTQEGIMTFGKFWNGLHTADFICCEEVETEPFTAQCTMQLKRDGNMYVTENPKRIRNKAIFRDDNSSFSHGQNGRYYFVFSMPEELLPEIPQELVRQAGAIAQKIIRNIIYNKAKVA